jgi:hypothetical protein
MGMYMDYRAVMVTYVWTTAACQLHLIKTSEVQLYIESTCTCTYINVNTMLGLRMQKILRLHMHIECRLSMPMERACELLIAKNGSRK